MNRTMYRRILSTALLLLALVPGALFAEERAAGRETETGAIESLLSLLPEAWRGFVVLLDDSGGSLDPWGEGKAVRPLDPEAE